MVGIRFHGRGGQGAVVASKILAAAYFKQGFYVQAFPSFGMERKGAAFSAFVRLDSIPIVGRGEIKHPDGVIVLDSSLTRKVDIVQGAKPGALILLNCKEHENQIPLMVPLGVPGCENQLPDAPGPQEHSDPDNRDVRHNRGIRFFI